MSETRAAVALEPEHRRLMSRRWMGNNGKTFCKRFILCYSLAQLHTPAAHTCNDVSCSCFVGVLLPVYVIPGAGQRTGRPLFYTGMNFVRASAVVRAMLMEAFTAVCTTKQNTYSGVLHFFLFFFLSSAKNKQQQ